MEEETSSCSSVRVTPRAETLGWDSCTGYQLLGRQFRWLKRRWTHHIVDVNPTVGVGQYLVVVLIAPVLVVLLDGGCPLQDEDDGLGDGRLTVVDQAVPASTAALALGDAGTPATAVAGGVVAGDGAGGQHTSVEADGGHGDKDCGGHVCCCVCC